VTQVSRLGELRSSHFRAGYSTRSACHCVGPDDWGDSFVEHPELLRKWIITVCELENALSTAHCTLGLLTSVERQRQVLVAVLSSIRFPEGGDINAKLLDYSFVVSQARLCPPEFVLGCPTAELGAERLATPWLSVAMRKSSYMAKLRSSLVAS
jgi:hypothetical protein